MATIKFADIGHIVDVAEFGGIHGIRFDLDSAANMADYLLAQMKAGFPPPWVFDGLCTAIVIRYSRAFIGGVRDASHAREALATLSADELALHQAILTMRDKHMAHSVNEEEENQVVAQYFEERVQTEGFVAISVQHGRTIGFSNEELAEIAQIARKLVSWLDAKIKELEARLFPPPASLPVNEILARGERQPRRVEDLQPERRRKKP